MFTIARHINGITLNTLEYMLDVHGEVLLFPTKKDAEDLLRKHGFTDEEIEDFIIEPEDPNGE